MDTLTRMSNEFFRGTVAYDYNVGIRDDSSDLRFACARNEHKDIFSASAQQNPLGLSVLIHTIDVTLARISTGDYKWIR